ncbi:DNA glycosylase [Serendipita vermifera]|nr:DNA glycosylase [Serendipita vermifera]
MTSPSSTSPTKFSQLLSTFAFKPSEDTRKRSESSSKSPIKRKRDSQDEGPSPIKKSPTKSVDRDISHLPLLQDRLQIGLDVIFCGCNPGYTSALVGYHYGNPQNAFWRCLHRAGFTETVLTPDQGPKLPERYNIGLTDLVARPSHSFSDIPGSERRQSVVSLLRKIAHYRPHILALNSFTIWSDIASQLDKRDPLPGIKLRYPGPPPRPPLKLARLEKNRTPVFIPWKIVYQDEGSDHQVLETLIIPLPGTSGANASYSLAEKVSFFKAVYDALPLIKDGSFDSSHMGEIIVLNPTSIG